MPYASECPALVSGHYGLGRVFQHVNAPALGNLHDGVHLAGHPGVVNRHNRPGAGGHCILEQALVKVQSVFPHVDENGTGPAQDECVGGGGESIRGHDDLVPGLDIGQQSRQLERCRTRVSQ